MIVILKYILDLIFNIMLISACVTITYAIVSVLIETICKDLLKAKEVSILLKENYDLREKVNRLEMELVDKELAKEYNDNKRTKIEF